MKHVLTFDTDDSLVKVTTEGEGDVEGIIAFLKDIISHPQWKPGLRILLDHRNLRIDQISVRGIKRVSDFFCSINAELGDGRIALVMKREIDFGIARAWEIVTADNVGIQIRVFHHLNEAEKWIRE